MVVIPIRKSAATIPLSSTTTTTLLLLTAFSILPNTNIILPIQAYTPFGYQSTTLNSYEYRNIDPTKPHTTPLDPSSYIGSIHYDPLHHSLYITGSTFASGSNTFDGIDVYNLNGEKSDIDNDGIMDDMWWSNMATGLQPHLLDVGIPSYSPLSTTSSGGSESSSKSDCYYAIVGLPPITTTTPNDIQSASQQPENEVKIIHSRRFGSEFGNEGCSSVDILFTNTANTPSTTLLNGETIGNTPGGYTHDNWDHSYEEGSQEQENMNGFDTNVNVQPGELLPALPGQSNIWPTYSPTVTVAPTTTPWPSLVGGGYAPTDLPTWDEEDEDEVVSTLPQAGLDNFGNEIPSDTTDTGGVSDGFTFEGDGERRQRHNRKLQTSQQTAIPPNIPTIETRSVRLLISGHVEASTQAGSTNEQDGYIINEFSQGPGTNEASVYGFAQQVDVRLPRGDLTQNQINQDINDLTNGNHDELDYELHSASIEEEQMAQDLSYIDGATSYNIPQNDYEKIVTSGIESRALLNDNLSEFKTIYPVSLVADPTSKKDYYVVLLASESGDENIKDQYVDANSFLNVDETIGQGASQRTFTEYETSGIDIGELNDNFGDKGRPNYGYNYRIIVKKMMIEGNVQPTELTDIEAKLAAQSYDEEKGVVAMREEWKQEFKPDLGDDVRPSGLLFAPKSSGVSGDGIADESKFDLLVMVGTTAGRGSAFGTASEDNEDLTDTGGPPKRSDLDGFITKIHTDTGAFAGGIDFNINTNQFQNFHSKRIASNPGKNDIIAGICSKPLVPLGEQETMEYVYIVGSTEALLPAVIGRLSSGNRSYDTMEAFLMKIELDTMKTVWTVQVGSMISQAGVDDYESRKGDVYGYGCAVTRDGQNVYLTGLVKDGGVVTDFSEGYDGGDNVAMGGTDIFISSYQTSNGSRNFLKQVGSTRDDFPSRGNGGITTDRLGNAIVTGNTRGSLMRKRIEDEFRYGQYGEDAAMDVFIMSFDRDSGVHVAVTDDGLAPAPVPVQPEKPRPVYPLKPTISTTTPAVENDDSPQDIETKNGALVGIVAFALTFIIVSVVASILVIYRIKKKKENDALMDSSNNLHGSRRRSSTIPGRRKSAWGINRSNSIMKDDFGDLNIMVEVRNSASGGWHGVYDDDQLQAIDFGVSTGGSDKGDVVEQSLFMEDGLQEIEESLSQYDIGDMPHMDDVSDEDLIKAYNDAMAIDIEPENPEVEFVMQGGGSNPPPECPPSPSPREMI